MRTTYGNWRLRLAALAALGCLAWAGGQAPAGAAADDLDTIDRLLRELRERRQARYVLQRDWQDEAQALRQQAELDRRRAEALAAHLAEWQQTNAGLRQRLTAARAANEQREQRLTAANDWLAATPERLRSLAATQAVLLDNAAIARLQQALNEASDVPARLRVYLGITHDLAQRAALCEATTRLVDVAGDKREMEVLRLGAALELAVSRDAQRCAWRAAAQPLWQPLPATLAPRLLEAVRLKRKEVAAHLVPVPVPPALIVDEEARP